MLRFLPRTFISIPYYVKCVKGDGEVRELDWYELESDGGSKILLFEVKNILSIGDIWR